MPAALAGVLWVTNEFPFDSRWRPNESAQRLAPTELTVHWLRR
ncbi:hypothetical protein [Streptomyces sp. TLI_235]|nr:hypothetical protein [Streptomyces sp. TLI_235]PBC70002.1 hypothetical protein BX265_7384 [Streptomyces sp. TLI_235]